MKNIGFGRCFGTFGEILQGALPNGKNFLVTLPIQKFSRCMFTVEDQKENLEIFPYNKFKSLTFAKLFLAYYDLPLKGTIIIDSDLPMGKGFASSSADLVATAYAINDFYQLRLSKLTIEEILAQIEPTDGVLYENVVSYYYLDVKLHKQLGNLPEMAILAMDEGGEVNTVEYNAKEKVFLDNERILYEKLLTELEEAIKFQDLRTIGRITTTSSVLNQKFRNNNYLEAMLNINKEIGGIGVTVTHSGTCLGILLDKNSRDLQYQISQGYKLMQKINNLNNIYFFHTLCWDEQLKINWAA